MTNSRVPLMIAAALLAALTGCATSSENGETGAAAPPAADSANKQREHQAQLATCMKGKGFTYHPMVTTPKLPDAIKHEMSGDYQGMRKYREKYGFGFAASFVYPNDGVGRMAWRTKEMDGAGDDPNGKVIAGLPKAQREAYFDAMGACTLQMINKVTGKNMKSMEEVSKAQGEMLKQIIAREIDGDPKLVELAGAFADCLKGKGYRVSSQRPSDIARSTEEPFMQEFGKLGQGKTPTADQARPLLQREIKASLEDLECGKDFYAAYRPKANGVYEKAQFLPGVGMMMATVAS